MYRPIPLWVFLLCFLLSGVFMMAFGWAVKSTLAGSDRSGFLGEAAVSIASFPTMVKTVFAEVKSAEDAELRIPATKASLAGFSPMRQRAGLGVSGLMIRADGPAMARAYGWRVLVGAFVIKGKVRNAALMISPDLEITKVWLLTEKNIAGQDPRTPYRKFVHGFDIMRDGSIIVSFDEGVSLQKFDYCGTRQWAIGGTYHHSVTLDDTEETAWVPYEDSVVQVSTATGKVLHEISMDAIIAANPKIDILAIRQNEDNNVGGNMKNNKEPWLKDPFHLNDVEPLPARLAGRFGQFKAGDLLISARSLNLLFVVDPKTLKILWWRMGNTRRQHDPDWEPNGTISVFDNRMGRDYSRIVAIDPKTFGTKVLLDGRKFDFYSRIRGKHQFSETGNLLITSAQQGRVFEVDPHGNVILEIVNRNPGSEVFNYVVSQAIWFPADHFRALEGKSCQNYS